MNLILGKKISLSKKFPSHTNKYCAGGFMGLPTLDFPSIPLHYNYIYYVVYQYGPYRGIGIHFHIY